MQHSLPTVDTNVDFALYNREILPTEERNKLNNLKPDKACGSYLRHVNVLQNCLNVDLP